MADMDAPEDDARLAARAAHDTAAFAALYRRHVPAVYRYCYHRLDNREQAEDATSQIFLRVLAALPSYRADAAFRSWLFTIAHNVATETGKSQGRLALIDARSCCCC